jgi:hypothetical protein
MGGGDGSGGMNTAGMMAGMALGGSMGSQMAGMMNQMGQNINQGQNTPPPIPNSSFYIVLNGQQAGPFNLTELTQMLASNQFNRETFAWKAGMTGWEKAQSIPELNSLFTQLPPPIPPTA